MLARHGPHQVAQKSSTTGRPRFSDMRNIFPSSVRTPNDGAARPPAPAVATCNAGRAAINRATRNARWDRKRVTFLRRCGSRDIVGAITARLDHWSAPRAILARVFAPF